MDSPMGSIVSTSCAQSLLRPIGSLAALVLVLCAAAPAGAETMSGALASAYASNPDLNQQRAGVRATDETLPQASAAWRPSVTAAGQYGFNYLDFRGSGAAAGAALGPAGGSLGGGGTGGGHFRARTDIGAAGVTVTQNIFNGNRTVNGAREALRNTELNVLLGAATAYMNVLRDTAILELDKNNIVVLEEQLRQTRDRFNVGEVTRTDVAQAESQLASARSTYFAAQANLQTSIADYRRIIGKPPGRLEPARTIESLLPRTLGAAVSAALAEHPSVQAALHAADAAALQVKLAEGELYPALNVVGTAQQNWNDFGVPGDRLFNASIGAKPQSRRRRLRPNGPFRSGQGQVDRLANAGWPVNTGLTRKAWVKAPMASFNSQAATESRLRAAPARAGLLGPGALPMTGSSCQRG